MYIPSRATRTKLREIDEEEEEEVQEANDEKQKSDDSH